MTSSKTCSGASCLFFLLIIVVGLGLGSPLSYAGSVKKSYVDYDGEEYHLNLIMIVNAPSTKVWRHLTNYNMLEKVNPAIQHSKVIKRGKITRVKVISKGCIWFFCRTIKQLQDIRDLGQGYLVVSEVKGKSDFSSGYTMWHVISHKLGAQVTIRSRLTPDFWIPPFIGPWLFKDALLQQGEIVINNLETLSKK